MIIDSSNRAIFLDRDGTIIEDKGHVGSVDDIVFFPFAIQALKMLQKEFLLFIVTNQSAVGLGKVSREAVSIVNSHILSYLHSEEVNIQKLYCCSHKKDDNCECIKPKPYFIYKAEQEYGIDIERSISIGDHPHDAVFGRAAGGNGIYILTGHGRKHLHELDPDILCFENLLDAACWILKKPMVKRSCYA